MNLHHAVARLDAAERERGGGAVSVPIAIMLSAMLAVAGLGVDGVRKAQHVATADALAEEAGRAGAQAVDPAAAQRGVARLDPAGARAAAERYLAATGTTGTVTVRADRVDVDVTLRTPTVLLGLVGIDTISTTGSAEVQLVPTIPLPDGAG
jgi:Protein of unknown function (DUF1152)